MSSLQIKHMCVGITHTLLCFTRAIKQVQNGRSAALFSLEFQCPPALAVRIAEARAFGEFVDGVVAINEAKVRWDERHFVMFHMCNKKKCENGRFVALFSLKFQRPPAFAVRVTEARRLGERHDCSAEEDELESHRRNTCGGVVVPEREEGE